MSSKLRTDIQALRALAVSMVVLFHFWPGRFNGGFAGVDVFFVISGFLITTHLVAQERVRFAEFWARRARRLLPAAFLVILVTLVASRFLIPPVLLADYAGEAIASVFYAENWVLAANSVDYFAQDASPYQHYWSLAVEEQFYIFWPLLIALLIALKRRFASGVALVSALSLAFAIYQTAVTPTIAYFNPAGRVWEFGLGALVATAKLPVARVKVATVLSALGFAGLAATLFLISPSALFPGLPALLPVLSTALVIYAGQGALASFAERFYGLRPIQLVGELSYGLYLWHWPLLILPAYLANGSLGTSAKLGLIVTCLVLAWLTKKLVEDRVRFARFLIEAKARRTLTLALIVSLLISGLAASIGASGSEATATKPALTLAEAKKDASDPGSKCMTKAEDSEVILCHFGVENAANSMLLVGDSHAATHLRAFSKIAEEQGWHLVLAYKAGCSFSLVERNQSARGTSCLAWNKNLQSELAGMEPFDLVVTNNYAANRLADVVNPNWSALAVIGYRQAWAPLAARGAEVVVIRDNPEMSASMADCFEKATLDASMCQMPLAEALFKDDAVTASEGMASVIDLTKEYCPDAVCPAKIGNTYVYRNKDHVSGTFDYQLWQPMLEQLVARTNAF